jgi:hypothetical protein
MHIDSSGRLLVGTSSDLSGGTTSTALQVKRSGGGYIGLARGDTSVTDGNDIGGLRFYTNDPSGHNDVGIIQCVADGTHNSDDYPTRLEFSTTADGESGPTERMRIDNSGNVGIGTDNPSTLLDVDGVATFSDNVISGTTPDWGNATSTGIALYPAAATNWIGIKNSSGSTATNTAFQVTYGTDTNISFQNNGAAEFAGAVTATNTCKAWVNFNGEGTVTIRDSHNVSSITDNGEGDYSINFTTDMNDANYAAVGGSSHNEDDLDYVQCMGIKTFDASYARMITAYIPEVAQSHYDAYWATLTVFGD